MTEDVELELLRLRILVKEANDVIRHQRYCNVCCVRVEPCEPYRELAKRVNDEAAREV